MIYLSGINRDSVVTIKRTTALCLYDEVIARVCGVERAKRWLRLYNYLFARGTL